MRRIYTYPRVSKKVIQCIQYAGLTSSLTVFWIGITFPSQIKNLSNAFLHKFLANSSQISKENSRGPYSDSLAKNFTKSFNK